MKTVPVLVALGFLVACSTVPTDVHYGEVGAVAGVDGGHSELRRGIDSWAVRYTGDQYMTGSTVRDLTLLRSAEVTQKANYQWFIVTEKVDESGHDLKSTSFSDVSSGQVTGANRVQSGASSGTRSTNTKFISQYRYEIKCYRDDPGLSEALDAAVVVSELRTKYGISG